MSFFKKLFGGNNQNEGKPTIPEKVEPTKVKQTIFDFFKIDLQAIPDDTFIKAEVGENSVGQSVENYRKSLDYKECGIFDTVEVKIIGGTSKNVFLKSFQPEIVKMDNLKRLIDDLYLIHGYDSSNKGKFTNKDIEDYRSTDFYMLFGRSWMEYPKYKFPVSVGRDEDEVSISIWGVGMED